MILPGQMIRMRGIFSPFCERQVHKGLSYGLSCAGYDVRLRHDVTLVQGYTVVAPIIEHINMPPDLLGKVTDKSTWARRGVQVQNTVIEPGWRGILAMELTYQPVLSREDADFCHFLNDGTKDFPNDDDLPNKTLKIEAGMPIAQVIIYQLMSPAEAPYRGKYFKQTADDIGAKMEESRMSDEEYSERKIYGDEIMPVTRDMAGELRRAGLWTEWDARRQSWLGRVRDVEAIEKLTSKE